MEFRIGALPTFRDCEAGRGIAVIVMAVDDSVLGTITKVLEPFRKGGSPIVAETDIAEDLSVDSQAMMDLMMELEERFDVSIPLNLLPEVRTVGDLVNTVRQLKGSA